MTLPSDIAIFDLASWCGLSPNELFVLRVRDLQGNGLRVGKGKVSLTNSLAQELQKLAEGRRPEEKLFRARRGGLWNPTHWLHTVLIPAAERANIHIISFPMLRRACSTLAANLVPL